MAPNPPIVVDEIVPAAKWNTGVYRYDFTTAEVDIVNVATEETLYSKEIGAGHMSSDRQLRLVIEGDMLQDVAQEANPTIRLKFGVTTALTITPVLPQSASRKGVVLEATIANLGAANSQWWRFQMFVKDPVSNTQPMPEVAATSIDSALAWTLSVTVQHGTASTTRSFRKKYAILCLDG